MPFKELGLSEQTCKAINELKFKEPTPIQKQAIPHILMARDVLGCAQTGTGKTGAFCLPLIDILATGKAKARMPRCLVLTPTRELADQINKNFSDLSKYHKLTSALIIGGTSMAAQEKKLMKGVDVLIATPGRLLDFHKQGKVLLNDVKIFICDEADRMLDMGFIPDIEMIVSKLPKTRQTLMFTATMAPEIRKIADKFLMNPKEVTVSPPSSTAKTVTQYKIETSPRGKSKDLITALGKLTYKNVIIFCNRKRDIDTLVNSLKRSKLKAQGLHGDMDQPQRQKTLEQFKNEEFDILVASDVAARGLDIKDLDMVINYDVPNNSEDYVHRIGRTGRAGKSGTALTLILKSDDKAWSAIEKLVGDVVQPFGEKPKASKKEEKAKDAPTASQPEKTERPEKPERPARHERIENQRKENREAPRNQDRQDKEERFDRFGGQRRADSYRKVVINKIFHTPHEHERRLIVAQQYHTKPQLREEDATAQGFGDEQPDFIK